MTKSLPARVRSGEDWLDVVISIVLFVIPPLLLLVSICASFTHIKDWALAHLPDHTPGWQGWAFACIVEVIPIFGVLLLWKLRRINHGLNVPRGILGVGFAASMAGQVAYAGGLSAGGSRLILATGPSIAGLALTEILLWLLRALTVADKPPTPTLVPPPPMTLPSSPLANVPPDTQAAVPLDTEPDEPPVSPWTTPPGTPLSVGVVPQDRSPDVLDIAPLDGGDIPQATALVPPSVSPSAGGVDIEGQALPDQGDSDAVSLTLSGGHVPPDSPEVDTVREGDTAGQDRGTAGLDPVDLDTWADHQKGMTKPQLAAKYGKSEKTIQRRLAKVREVIDSTTPEEEHSNA